MTHFHKSKRKREVTPLTCDCCRQQPGSVHLQSLADVGEAAGKADWWLCASCAQSLGRDEPREQ